MCCFQSGCWLSADFHNLPISASQPQAAAWHCCLCSCQGKALTLKHPTAKVPLASCVPSTACLCTTAQARSKPLPAGQRA